MSTHNWKAETPVEKRNLKHYSLQKIECYVSSKYAYLNQYWGPIAWLFQNLLEDRAFDDKTREGAALHSLFELQELI